MEAESGGLHSDPARPLSQRLMPIVRQPAPETKQEIFCVNCDSAITDEREQRCPWCCEPMCRTCWVDCYAGQCRYCLKEHGSPNTEFKVTQPFAEEHGESDSPSSPGNRHSGASAGTQGKRSSTEHAVSEANPRRGMKLRASEARRP